MNSDKIVASKDRFKEYLSDYHNVSKSKIEVLPQIIDVDLHPVEMDKKYDLLFIGRMSLPKNWPIIEKIAEQTNIKIIALTPEVDGSKTLPGNLVVKEKVAYKDLAKEISAAKVFIMPSFMETGPRVTLEAMMCGLPVVASIEGAGGFVENGVNGFVIKDNEPESYVLAIEKILNNQALYETMSKNNKLKATKYTTDALSTKYLRVLTDV